MERKYEDAKKVASNEMQSETLDFVLCGSRYGLEKEKNNQPIRKKKKHALGLRMGFSP